MRAHLVVAVSAVVLVPASAGAGGDLPTALRVTYWASSASSTPTSSWTLACSPPRGTLPRPAVACRKLAAGGPRLFAPVPRGVACTQIYGGPQRARVVGLVDGTRVWAVLTRTDGCQVERWNRLAPWLLPPGGVSP